MPNICSALFSCLQVCTPSNLNSQRFSTVHTCKQSINMLRPKKIVTGVRVSLHLCKNYEVNKHRCFPLLGAPSIQAHFLAESLSLVPMVGWSKFSIKLAGHFAAIFFGTWPLVDFEKKHAGHAVGRLLPFFTGWCHWLSGGSEPIVHPLRIPWLVVQFHHLEKWWSESQWVSDDIPFLWWKIKAYNPVMFETTKPGG